MSNIHTITIESNDATIQFVNGMVLIWKEHHTDKPPIEIEYEDFMGFVRIIGKTRQEIEED